MRGSALQCRISRDWLASFLASSVAVWWPVSAISATAASDPPISFEEAASIAGPSSPPATLRTNSGVEPARPSQGPLSSPYHSSSSAAVHIDEDYVIRLADGKKLDIAAHFGKRGKRFERQLRRAVHDVSTVRVQYEKNRPFLVIAHRNSCLNGPTAAFYRDGPPMVYLNYSQGKRNGTLFAWDERYRPWVFAEYKSGKKHGISCVFRACSDQCQTNHVWLVQEWRLGRLHRSHLIDEYKAPHTIDHRNDNDSDPPAMFAAAADELESFESQLGKNEQRLRTSVTQYINYQQQAHRVALATYQRRLAAALSGRMRTARSARVCGSGKG
jgi:hypothetical protein